MTAASACTAAANDCSLRGAVIKANTTAGTDTINLSAGTYTLTITGTGEEAAMAGDLDLTESVILQGAGAETTIIQAATSSAGGIDRVFHVPAIGITVEFRSLTIRHGLKILIDGGGGIFNRGTVVVIRPDRRR